MAKRDSHQLAVDLLTQALACKACAQCKACRRPAHRLMLERTAATFANLGASNGRDERAQQLFTQCVITGHQLMIRLMLKAGVPPDIRVADGKIDGQRAATPLFMAVEFRHRSSKPI